MTHIEVSYQKTFILFKKIFLDLFTTTEDLLYASIGVKHCFVSNKLLK